MTPRFEIRAATPSDQDGLLRLAKYLDSVNLPDDPVAIEKTLATSEASFSGQIGDPRRREYVFVLWDRDEGRPIGTSMIVGQLGRRDAPYTFFDVRTEERYSSTLDRHFTHTILDIGYSYNGPTEIGGLVMDPKYRRSRHKLGMQISYVRFLWIAMHEENFQNYLLAELLPPLEPDGTSHLWEAVGRKFTGLTYREADRMTSRNKEFIRGLFPDAEIYATLLPQDAQDVIGKVGPQTRGVEKLLRRIGFEYAHRVDPFDGGPHFIARRNEVTLVERSRAARLSDAEPGQGAGRALLGMEYDRSPWFRVMACPVEVVEGGEVRVPAEVRAELGAGEAAWILPLD